MRLSANLNVMTEAVKKASRKLLRDFGELEKLQVSKKGPGDFVTIADTRTEKSIIESLKKARPNYSFLTEETGEIPGNGDHRWILDPIDGTKNFMHAIPYFCISLALEKLSKDGTSELVAAVIYNPIADEMFFAERNQGAFLNDTRIRVSARKQMDECIFSAGLPHNTKASYNSSLKSFQNMAAISAGLRCGGSAALDLAYTAAGRFEGCFFPELCPWDMAAGILLVREAGGVVTEMNGGKDMMAKGSIFASNGLIHEKVLPHLVAA